jgi:hypothetical protein
MRSKGLPKMPRNIFIRSRRAQQVPGIEGGMPAPRAYPDLVRNTIAVASMGVIGGVLIWQWSAITDGIAAGEGPGQPHSAQDFATALPIALLYEEDPNDPVGKRLRGSAIWSTEEVPSEGGKPSELAVRADIEIPERKLGVIWTLRRVTENSGTTSHTIEITFKLPPDFPSRGISNVPGVWLKPGENVRGNALAGLVVKVTTGDFLMGLSGADKERNIELLKERPWFEIPIVYTNYLRAILAVEKGAPGERAFAQAFAGWEK